METIYYGRPIPEYPCNAIVYKDGNKVIARDMDGKLIAKGNAEVDDAKVIQSAIDYLTTGRTWKETVALIGNFTISESINIPSYTHIILNGIIEVDRGWSPTYNRGVFEIGTKGSIVRDVEITGGKIVGNYFSTYPTASGNNAYVMGIHSMATLIDAYIHNMYFNNLLSPITLETLGANKGIPSRFITIENIRFKDVYVGVQTYANGYEYRDVLIQNIRAENSADDVVAVVGHYGGVPGAVPHVKNVTVKDIIVYDKNGHPSAVVKLDAGDCYDGSNGYMENITIEDVNAYTSSNQDSAISLLKGLRTEKVIINNIQARGEFNYGIILFTNGHYIKMTNLNIQSNYQIFIFCGELPHVGQDIQIEHATLMPRESDVNNYTVAGYGITLAAGTNSQGIENLKVRDVFFWYTKYPIYEGTTLPTGVQGTYQNNYYEIDIGNRQYSDLVITSNPVELVIYRSGVPLTRKMGTASITGDGSTTTFTIPHGLVSTPNYVNVLPKAGAPTPDSIDADATNITLTFSTAPESGTYYYWWEARL